MLAARDDVDFGEPGFTDPLVLDQWRSREFDDSHDAIVAEDGGGVVGYAAVFPPGALAFTHPEREGEGIGHGLRTWAEERGRDRGTLRQRVGAANRGARTLLESAGYQHVRSVHTLAWAGQPALAPVSLPDGISWHTVDSERDARELHELDMLAFSKNADYSPETLEAFVDEHLRSPDLHRPSTRIARRGEQAAGFVVCRLSGDLGGVDLLAVLPEHRHQGVGRALLCQALTTLAADGAREVRLDVASDNPQALRLYRGIGMTDRHEVAVYEKPARAE